MLAPEADWPLGPVAVDPPEPWPPAEYPHEWPAGADAEYVLLEATWGDPQCLDLVRRCVELNAGIAADGQHRDLRAYAGGGD